MAGRHERPLDPNAPPLPAPVDRRLILAAGLVLLAVLITAATLKFHLLGGGGSSAAEPTGTATSVTGNSGPGTTGAGTSKSPSGTGATKPSPSVKPSMTTTPTSKPGATTKPSPTKPSPTKPAPTKPSPTKPAPTKPSTTKPAPTKPSPTKPVSPPPPPAPHYPLLVLNNSAISGLGTAAAADFEAGGWTIAGVGNLTGRLKDTTVYYNAGYRASALALAQQFPQLHRVLPRIPGLPGHAALTVVVTRYYEIGGGG